MIAAALSVLAITGIVAGRKEGYAIGMVVREEFIIHICHTAGAVVGSPL